MVQDKNYPVSLEGKSHQEVPMSKEARPCGAKTTSFVSGTDCLD